MESGGWKMSVLEEEEEMRKGPWIWEEDMKLVSSVSVHGPGRWSWTAKAAGLKRSGKSCRLRWLNYLRPDLKRGNITPEEERLILDLHCKWGNRWSRIAQSLPGRTDNEIKNYWRTHVKKKFPHLRRSSSWPPSSKSPTQIEAIEEMAKPSSSTNTLSCFDIFETNRMEECCADSSPPTIPKRLEGGNEDICDTFEFHGGNPESLGNEESEMFKNTSTEDGTAWSCCFLGNSPMNTFSEDDNFFWDYDSVMLWDLDDDTQNMPGS